MNAILIRSMTLAVAALALPLHASAQTIGTASGAGEIDQVRREARSHLGPIYLTPTILLKELGVDSNVFNAAGEQKSDFTFTVGPKVDLWLPVARRALFQGTAATDLVLVRAVRLRAIGRSAVCGTWRGVPAPRHPVCERPIRQHVVSGSITKSTCGRATWRMRPTPASTSG